MSENSSPFGPEVIRPAAEDGNPLDEEASDYAVRFMMPEGTFRAVMFDEQGSTPRIAEAFCMPEAAVIRRARLLGLEKYLRDITTAEQSEPKSQE